jgi:thiamine biosynthesis lipoprotein
VIVERAAPAMGSEVRFTARTSDQAAAESAFDAAVAEFNRLDRLLSVWHESSDVSRLNAAAGDYAVALAPETLEILQVALRVSEWTGGKFDVTFGALSGLWRFDHDQDDRIPTREAVARQLPLVGYEWLHVDSVAQTAFLEKRGARVHLGGIGKGFAVDRAAALFRSRGLHDFMIQSGGDLYVAGDRGDRPWRVGIRDPRGPADQIFAALHLSDGTFSTSGDYERSFIQDGRRYHHLLDPDRGEPASGCRSVTIVAPNAIVADALSTGVFIMGPESGMALVERLPGIEAVVVTKDNEVLVSSGLEEHLTLVAPPTDAI